MENFIKNGDKYGKDQSKDLISEDIQKSKEIVNERFVGYNQNKYKNYFGNDFTNEGFDNTDQNESTKKYIINFVVEKEITYKTAVMAKKLLTILNKIETQLIVILLNNVMTTVNKEKMMILKTRKWKAVQRANLMIKMPKI